MATNLPSYETAVDLATRKRRGIPGLAGQSAEEPEVDVLGGISRGLSSAFPPPPPGGYTEEQYNPPPLPPPPAAPARPVAPTSTMQGAVPPSAVANPTPIPQGNEPVGPDTAVTARSGGREPARGGGQDYHDRVKAVRMPSGKIVFTNVPAALQDKGGAQVDYGTAMEETTGRPYRGGVNVYEGPAGTVFSQPGQEVATAAAMGRMGPPAPLEASLPELTDPVAIWERQQWMEGRGAMERATRQEEAKTAASEAAAEAATARAAVDPLAAAQIEAEGRYGGEMIQQEGRASETNLALRVIAEITDRQNKLRATMPPGPDRDALVNQLEQDKKLYLVAIRPQAAAGLMRPDPFAAFGMPTPAPPTETSPPKKQ